jgi:HK97 family phage portal protein
MGFLNAFKRTSDSTQDEMLWNTGLFNSESNAGVNVNQQTALNSTAVMACVTMLAEDFAKLTPGIYRINPATGAREAADDHPLYQLLFSPNDWQNWFEFAEMLQISILLRGNGYAVIVRDRRNDPIKLIPVNADWVALWEAPTGELFYRVTSNGLHMMAEMRHEPFLIPAEDVFHVRGFSANGLLGASRIMLGKEAIGLSLGQEQQASRWMANRAHLSGVLSTEQKLTKDAATRMAQDWKDAKGGLQNAGKIAVLEQGLKYIPIAMTANDLQIIAQRTFQLQEVARLFRVPLHMLGDLSRCVPASTLVYTVDGPKHIPDVKEGDFVWSCDGSQVRMSRVIGCYDNGEDDILEIKTTNRTTRCNPAHRILARRAHEEPLLRGQKGGRNVDGKKVRVSWRTEYVAAGDLRVGDTIVTLNSIPDIGGDTAPNGRSLTVGFMEFCGLLLGDGNLIKVRDHYVGVQIARASTANYMDHYRVVAREEFTAGGTVHAHGERHGMAKLTLSQVQEIRNAETKAEAVALGDSFSVSRATVKAVRGYRNWNEPVRCADRPILLVEQDRQTSFKSVVAAAELEQLGFAGTAFTKSVPCWVFGLRADLRLAILRGFLDADGTVNKLGRISFDSANRYLIEGIRHLCMGLGIPVTNIQVTDQESQPPCAKHPHITRMYRFTCSDPEQNRRIGSHDARYVDRMAAGKGFARKDRHYNRRGGDDFNIDGASLASVVSIEKQAREHVFDIEVDGTHCFVADGVIVHNSTNNNISQQSMEYINLTLSSYTMRWRWKLHQTFGLGPVPGGHVAAPAGVFVDFDLSELTRADVTALFQNNARGISGGFLTQNEARAKAGYDPKPGGDVLLSPSNLAAAGSQSSQGGADGGGRPADGSAEQTV